VSVRQQIRGSASGTKVRHTAPSRIADVKVRIPALPVQQRIAGILSAYDDLIENSQRRIKTLESMARILYREWFVSENLPSSLTTQSPILGRFGDLCFLTKDAFTEGLHFDHPLLDLSRMTQHCLAPGETGAANELTTSRIIFKPGDTLFGAIRCYLHKVNLAHFSGVTNTSVLVLRPKTAAFRSFLAILASDVETIRWADTHSTGTKMPVINWGVFQAMPAPLPPEALAVAFEDVVGPLLDQMGLLATQIQNLRRTRDLLIPRLLSGKVDVEVA
jgi:type I restriction enzyme S subunit